jgi:hypothetical protein
MFRWERHDARRRETTTTAAELTEIRYAFRQRLATERLPKKPARRKRKPKPPLVLVREPGYDDANILTPALVAELFAVSPRAVRRWADAGTLPAFRTIGGPPRFRAYARVHTAAAAEANKRSENNDSCPLAADMRRAIGARWLPPGP